MLNFNPGYEEIVAATYTGKVFALSSVPAGAAGAAASATGGKRVNTETCARIAKLKSEIDDLQQAGFNEITSSIESRNIMWEPKVYIPITGLGKDILFTP